MKDKTRACDWAMEKEGRAKSLGGGETGDRPKPFLDPASPQ